MNSNEEGLSLKDLSVGDVSLIEKIVKSRFENEGTEYFAREILRTKVPGTNDALTWQQIEAAQAWKKIFAAKLKRAKDIELTEEEKFLAQKLGLSRQAARSTGKTGFECMLALNTLVCYPGKTVVIFVGPDEDQVKKVSWSQMSQFVEGSLLKDEIIVQKKSVYLKSDSHRNTIDLSQRRYIAIEAASSNVKSVSGQHPTILVIIFTEATGIEREICKEIENTMGFKGGVSIMWVGYNPDRPVCYASETQTINREMFDCNIWSARESPLADKDFIRKKIEIHGEDSPEILINVDGILPPSSTDAMINWGWLQEAVNRKLNPARNSMLVFAIDPARSSDGCECVLGAWQEWWYKKLWAFNIDDTVLLADRICENIAEFISDGVAKGEWDKDIDWRIAIEMDGGGSLYDTIKHHPSGIAGRNGYKLIKVQMNSAVKRKYDFQKFKTHRDELWYQAKKLFENRIIKIPDDQKLISQLGQLTYDTSSGFWRAFQKKELKKSPDRADVIAIRCEVPLAFNYPEQKTNNRKYVDKRGNKGNNNYGVWAL